MRAFLWAFASCIALILGACQEGDSAPAPTKPAPPAPTTGSRAGLLYGYYGSQDGQVAETADHVTLQWVSPWGAGGDGLQAIINRLTEARAAGIGCVVLDVPMAYTPAAEGEMRSFFATLHGLGLIDSRICALYPIDEPDLNGKSAEEVRRVNALVRRVAAEFPFIAGIPLAVIYTGKRQWPGIETYDWVGFDDYDRKEGVLSGETWMDMKRRLRPEQRILLVPGGHQCDNVADFYRRAQEDSQVLAIVAFIWFDNWDGPRQGIRSLPCRQSYIDAALQIKTPTL